MFASVGRSTADTLLDELTRRCGARGMNLVGVVDAAQFDDSQPCGRRARERMPTCDTVVLLGSGGRAAWEAVLRESGAPLRRARPGYHPIDRWSASVAGEASSTLRAAGCEVAVVRPDEKRPMNFRQLAEMVGFGTISPVIGHLLHPVYGPWVSLRVALLVAGRPFGSQAPTPLADFEPCCGCSQPCRESCPSGVHERPGEPDLLRCATSRVAGGCPTGCHVLRACPVGAEHRYGPDEERFRHAYSLFAMRRWVGAGMWRFVPEFVRRRL